MKTNIDFKRAEETLVKGKELLDKEQLIEAIDLLKPLQAIFEKEEDWEKLVKRNNYISRCYITLSKLNEAKELLVETLKICKAKPISAKEDGVCKNNFGVLYMAKGEWNNAINFFKEAIQQSKNGSPVQIARMYLNAGTCYLALYDHQKALEYYNYFDEITLDEYDKDALWVMANYYANKGNLYANLDHNEYAILHYQKALYILEERLNCKGYVNRAQPNINIANSYMNYKKPDIAAIYYERGEALMKKAFGNSNHPMFFYTKGAKTSILIEQKKYKEAIGVYLELQKEYPKHRDMDTLNSRIGDAYYLLGDYNNALQYYNERAETLNKKDWYLKAELNLKIAETYRCQNNLESALKILVDTTLLLKAKRDEKSKIKFTYYTDVEQLILKSSIVGANIYFEFYKESNNNIYLKKCNTIIRNGLKSYSKIKNSSTNDLIYKITLDADKLFQLSVEIFHLQYQLTKNIDDFEIAFEASEKNKSIALLKQMAAKHHNKILPLEEALKEKDINFNLKHYEKIVNLELNKPEPNREQITNWQNKCHELYNEKNKLIEQIALKAPNYFNWKYQTKTISITNLQKVLKANELFVEYFSTKQHIYIFAITQKKVALVQQKINGDLKKRVVAFNQLLQGSLIYKIAQAGKVLYDILIKPIEHLTQEAKSLKIIPDNHLAQLPFEALISKKPETLTPQQLPYLICSHRITYHYSAGLYYYSKTKASNQKNYTKQFGGFAPVYKSKQIEQQNVLKQELALRVSKNNDELNELVYSETEVQSVANLFKKNEAEVFLHEKATVKNFVQKAADYKYLLVAAHHIYNNLLPENSGILFAPVNVNSNTKTLDNHTHSYLNNHTFIDAITSQQMLFEADAYGLQINADLVILSCCETGLGKVVTGEGIMGINRGFLFAGAKNIISTLFKVYDKQSSKFSFYLFDNIVTQKQGYDEAIRNAKLSMIDDELTLPKDWAGYVLMGN